jgi:hypothetical protein
MVFVRSIVDFENTDYFNNYFVLWQSKTIGLLVVIPRFVNDKGDIFSKVINNCLNSSAVLYAFANRCNQFPLEKRSLNLLFAKCISSSVLESSEDENSA